jgi:phage shock protein B
MMNVGIGFIGMILASAVVLLVPFLLLLLLIRVVFGGSSGRQSQTSAEETRMIQEIHHELLEMEKRVEALETILMDRVKQEDPA